MSLPSPLDEDGTWCDDCGSAVPPDDARCWQCGREQAPADRCEGCGHPLELATVSPNSVPGLPGSIYDAVTQHLEDPRP